MQGLFRSFFTVSSYTALSRVLGFIRDIFIAKYLGPSDYGLLKSIEMIQMLNKWGNLGFRQTANREIGNLIGKKDLILFCNKLNIKKFKIISHKLLFFASNIILIIEKE